MKAGIRQRAQELGFDDCCITTANPPASATQFRHWLAHHRQGEMAYLERNAHKRVDPQQVLPGAKSIITLAVSYADLQSPKSKVQSPKPDENPPVEITPRELGHTQHATRNTQPASPIAHHASRITRQTGLVARYAHYDDYHAVFATRLKQLTDYVNQLGGPNTRSLWYVDTGPLLERDLAQRAGLGFIGKHTNLISRSLGNWTLLCEVITTLELEPDLPETNHCGSCTRCITACPTGAIAAPFQLDARRCISYLTIELKGPIPFELRPAVGNRIFGCDDCLAVCPWNRFAREGRTMKAHARPDLATPDLVNLLTLDEAGFQRRFARTPILRTRRRGLLRNVCVALGNVGDSSAIAALEQTANDPEPLVGEHARWAIEQIQRRQTQNPAPPLPPEPVKIEGTS